MNNSLKKFLHGIGGSPGKHHGKALVVKDPNKIPRISSRGVVLVTPFVTPFQSISNASSLVTDKGGMTSHGANVARELGIPCVVGTEVATKILRSGMKVLVDGDKGLVEY